MGPLNKRVWQAASPAFHDLGPEIPQPGDEPPATEKRIDSGTRGAVEGDSGVGHGLEVGNRGYCEPHTRGAMSASASGGPQLPAG